MSDQPQQPAGGAPAESETDLEAYMRANRAALTEDALRRAALDAGHTLASVDAALAATRNVGVPAATGATVRRIFVIYLAVYLILDVLMLVNPANQGTDRLLGDTRGIGILILSVALGAGFLASLVWVANRYAFWFLIGALLAVSGLGSMANNGFAGIVSLVAGGALIAVTVAVARRGGPRSTPSRELLLSMPLLILLVVGGACVASGLPIPRPA
jgi:hypothetical protein